MLFLDLTQGKLASYSLRLQFPSNFAVRILHKYLCTVAYPECGMSLSAVHCFNMLQISMAQVLHLV